MNVSPPSTSEPLLLPTDAAAERLGVNYLWLKRQAAAGLVQHTRVGRRVLFSADDLAAFIAHRTVAPVNKPA